MRFQRPRPGTRSEIRVLAPAVICSRGFHAPRGLRFLRKTGVTRALADHRKCRLPGAGSPARDGVRAKPMKISIILPLFDRRTTGWRSLESAVDQSFPRDRYEVVAVTGSDLERAADDPVVGPLLARCDAVVRTDLDTSVVANELAFYQAGYQRASGDLLLFMEGHTVLATNCCALIDDYFHGHPMMAMAWAPRINHGETPLGRLVSLHNLRHERRAIAQGMFSLGANSVIRRDVFARLGAFDPRYRRFGETAILQRAQAEGIAIGRIDLPLATHCNDMHVDLWRDLVTQMGHAKFGYYSALRASGENLRAHVRHPVYLAAGHPWSARVFHPLFRAAGAVFLHLATRSLRVSESFASALYVLAVGFVDLSGYCSAYGRKNVLS